MQWWSREPVPVVEVTVWRILDVACLYKLVYKDACGFLFGDKGQY